MSVILSLQAPHCTNLLALTLPPNALDALEGLPWALFKPKDRSLDASGPFMLQYGCQAARDGLAVALDVGASQGIFL